MVEAIDRLLYKFLKTKQKQYLSSLLTKKQKQRLKRIIKPGKKQRQMEKMRRVKFRRYNLGFTERALADLKAFSHQDADLYLKHQVAWELAVYYANQYTESGAEKCIEIIEQALTVGKDEDDLRRSAILKAESSDILGEQKEAERVLAHASASKIHADLYLAQANLETSFRQRIRWINKIYDMHQITTVTCSPNDNLSPYDQLMAETNGLVFNNLENAPKVSVIIPVYNAEKTIQTALNAILNQTWARLEILVVDDIKKNSRSERKLRGFASPPAAAGNI